MRLISQLHPNLRARRASPRAQLIDLADRDIRSTTTEHPSIRARTAVLSHHDQARSCTHQRVLDPSAGPTMDGFSLKAKRGLQKPQRLVGVAIAKTCVGRHDPIMATRAKTVLEKCAR